MCRHRIQPLVCGTLITAQREAERYFRERFAALGRELRRQRDGEVRAFDEVLVLGEEILQNVRQHWVGRAEAGGEEIVQGTDHLVGDDRGDHG